MWHSHGQKISIYTLRKYYERKYTDTCHQYMAPTRHASLPVTAPTKMYEIIGKYHTETMVPARKICGTLIYKEHIGLEGYQIWDHQLGSMPNIKILKYLTQTKSASTTSTTNLSLFMNEYWNGNPFTPLYKCHLYYTEKHTTNSSSVPTQKKTGSATLKSD